ncbi:DUF6933 domain-containing protein [Endozoicomonas ascidiicola]|uniref:DUF6933 domain-containing protein n=1 Tax=Endozoicomonas ascidiicola TaxID=1698521 RepID=UPI00082ADA1B|nr:hypothetical protein [Endozoicomonas ascidiicola]
MIQLRCTKKVQDLLSLKKENLSEPSDSQHIIGNWFVNVFTQNRRNILVYMNEKTLLSFIIVGVTKSKAKLIIEGFPIGLAHLLDSEGFSDHQISKVVESLQEIYIAPTASRKFNGNMNDLIFMYQNHIEMDGGLEHCDLEAIIKKVNRTPQRNIDWEYSITKAKKLLISAT